MFWNCRGLLPNADDVNLLETQQRIGVCLQEAYLNPPHTNPPHAQERLPTSLAVLMQTHDYNTRGYFLLASSAISCYGSLQFMAILTVMQHGLEGQNG